MLKRGLCRHASKLNPFPVKLKYRRTVGSFSITVATKNFFGTEASITIFSYKHEMYWHPYVPNQRRI